MQLEAKDLTHLADVACKAALEAGALISSYSDREVEVMHKDGGDTIASQVVTEVDELSQEVVLKHLEPTISEYDLALLTEESEDNGSRLVKDYFWCIDPLDGTHPFTQRMPGYAVSIALVARDGNPVIGVIYDPVEDKLYRAVAGQGIEIDGKAWTKPEPFEPAASQLCFYHDSTFATNPERDTILRQVESAALKLGYTGLDVQIGGGGVLNACWVLENPPACFFKKDKPVDGGGSFWDFAATACLFEEADTYVSDMKGERLELNREASTFMNHCGVCYATDASIAAAIREVL